MLKTSYNKVNNIFDLLKKNIKEIKLNKSELELNRVGVNFKTMN